jgi:hypothetical protein
MPWSSEGTPHREVASSEATLRIRERALFVKVLTHSFFEDLEKNGKSWREFSGTFIFFWPTGPV